jgi:hypothetical protein
MNGLTAELREYCAREDRRSLPSHFPHPRNCYGDLILPETPGMAGAEAMTEKEVKKYLDWQQSQQEKGLPY